MSKELDRIKEQSKKNKYKKDGTPKASGKRLEQRGVEEYLEKEGGLSDDDSVEVEETVYVGSGFNADKLKEKQKQKETLEESEVKEMRGAFLDDDGEETSLGSNVEDKLEEMKVEEQKVVDKFEINREAKSNPLNSLWNISQENETVIEKSYNAFGTEFGMYASIPMLCKGSNCVYAELYPELHGDLHQPGERCPVEVAIILSRYEQYKEDLMMDPEDAVDMSILRDVIDYDIQIIRAENKVAVEGDFVKDVVVGISNSGQEIMQEQITQASEYKQKIQAARNKALNLLNSTRKDKAGEKVRMEFDPSSYSKELLARANKEVFDADFEEVGEEAAEEENIFDGLEVIADEPFMQKDAGDTNKEPLSDEEVDKYND